MDAADEAGDWALAQEYAFGKSSESIGPSTDDDRHERLRTTHCSRLGGDPNAQSHSQDVSVRWARQIDGLEAIRTGVGRDFWL